MMNTRRIAILCCTTMLAIQSNCATFAASAASIVNSDTSNSANNKNKNNKNNKYTNTNSIKPHQIFQVNTCADRTTNKKSDTTATGSTACIAASAKEAAFALNSHDFLQALIANKNTKDEVYSDDIENDSHSCEYTGTLWFGKQKGIRFRETMRILKNDDENKATVECFTRYHNGKSWVDCARVLCSLNRLQGIRNDDVNGALLQVEVGSELLMDLWVPGVAGAACKKISRTFEDAASAFFQRWQPSTVGAGQVSSNEV